MSDSLLDSWLGLQTWPDCREMVERSPTRYIHPYGFVVSRTAVDLFEGWQIRVHLWPAGAGTSGDLPVHAHGWSLCSKVVLGELEETSYRLVDAPDGGYTVDAVDSAYGVGASVLRSTGRRVRIANSEAVIRNPRSGIYRIETNAYHSTTSASDQLSVSLVATATTGGSSHVLAPVGFSARLENERRAAEHIEQVLDDADAQYRAGTADSDGAASFVFVRARDGRYLMLHTKRNPQLWTPVGGREEKADRDPAEIAIRELKEELGLQVATSELTQIGVRDRDVGEGQVHFWLYILNDVNEMRLQSDEIAEIDWFDRHALADLDLFPATRAILSEL